MEMERFYLWLKTLPSDTHDVDQIFLPGSEVVLNLLQRIPREKDYLSANVRPLYYIFMKTSLSLFFVFSSGFGGDWSGGDGDASRGKRPRGKREKQLFKPSAGIWDVSGSHLISEVINWLIDRVVHPGLHGDNSRQYPFFFFFFKRRLKSGVSGRSGDGSEGKKVVREGVDANASGGFFSIHVLCLYGHISDYVYICFSSASHCSLASKRSSLTSLPPPVGHDLVPTSRFSFSDEQMKVSSFVTV